MPRQSSEHCGLTDELEPFRMFLRNFLLCILNRQLEIFLSVVVGILTVLIWFRVNVEESDLVDGGKE